MRAREELVVIESAILPLLPSCGSDGGDDLHDVTLEGTQNTLLRFLFYMLMLCVSCAISSVLSQLRDQHMSEGEFHRDSGFTFTSSPWKSMMNSHFFTEQQHSEKIENASRFHVDPYNRGFGSWEPLLERPLLFVRASQEPRGTSWWRRTKRNLLTGSNKKKTNNNVDTYSGFFKGSFGS